MDEIYYAFIINDMMAKAATGQASAEDAVKGADAAMRKHHEEVGRQGLTTVPGPRARRAVRRNPHERNRLTG